MDREERGERRRGEGRDAIHDEVRRRGEGDSDSNCLKYLEENIIINKEGREIESEKRWERGVE